MRYLRESIAETIFQQGLISASKGLAHGKSHLEVSVHRDPQTSSATRVDLRFLANTLARKPFIALDFLFCLSPHAGQIIPSMQVPCRKICRSGTASAVLNYDHSNHAWDDGCVVGFPQNWSAANPIKHMHPLNVEAANAAPHFISGSPTQTRNCNVRGRNCLVVDVGISSCAEW